MKTTQLIIEHLIAGIQMMIWLLLLIFTVTGTEGFSLSEMGINDTVALSIAVAFVYPLGIIIDNMADLLLKNREMKIRQAIPGGTQSIRRLLIMLKDASTEEQFSYIRMRIRISRSACLNFFMLSIALLAFTIFQLGDHAHFANLIVLELIAGAVLVFLSYYSWFLLTKSCYGKLAQRYEELEADKEKQS